MISIGTGTLAALLGMVGCLATLAGLAVAWGVTQATIRQLKELVGELRSEVADLKREVGGLRVTIAEMQGAQRVREATGSHKTIGQPNA